MDQLESLTIAAGRSTGKMKLQIANGAFWELPKLKHLNIKPWQRDLRLCRGVSTPPTARGHCNSNG